MNSKKGETLSETISIVAALIAIALILTVYIFGAGIARNFFGTDGGVKMYAEEDAGVSDVFSYIQEHYPKLLKTKALFVSSGDSQRSFEVGGYYVLE